MMGTILWNLLEINQQVKRTLQEPRRSGKFMLWSKELQNSLCTYCPVRPESGLDLSIF